MVRSPWLCAIEHLHVELLNRRLYLEVTMLNFDVSAEEQQLIQKIAIRAYDLPWNLGQPNILQIMMDITGCRCNGCPLRLAAMLEADDFNFAHDVAGIMRHINRKTGELMDCFSPRYALPLPASIDPGAELEKAIFG
jgi:hypothetical protein